MEKRILDLFDNWLGRFSFFRGIIKILLDMNKNIENIQLREADSNKTIIKLENKFKSELQALREELENLTEKLNNMGTENINQPSNFTRSSDIMDRQFDLYKDR